MTVVGNQKAIKQLESSLESGRVSHAYLFVGPENIGKTTVAIEFARKLMCPRGGKIDCDCHDCRLINAGSHPDLHMLDRVEKGGIEEVRELTRALDLRPYQAKFRVALVPHADTLSVMALNAFLKTLEEPNPNTVIILTTENKQLLLDTIISRSRVLHFAPIRSKEIFEYLNQELGIKKGEAEIVTLLSGGRLGYAVTLSQDPQNATEIYEEAKNLDRIFRTKNLYEKISFAGKLSSEKNDSLGILSGFETYFRNKLIVGELNAGGAQSSQIYVHLIDCIEAAKRLLERNVNKKLVFEALLLGSITE